MKRITISGKVSDALLVKIFFPDSRCDFAGNKARAFLTNGREIMRVKTYMKVIKASKIKFVE